MADELQTGVIKKFMFVNRKAPYGTVYALEVLEMVLISAAFDQDVHLAFLDDGVYALKKGQDARAAGLKTFANTYRALEGYDIEKVYVEREALDERGLTVADLLIEVELIDRAGMAALMESMDVVLTA